MAKEVVRFKTLATSDDAISYKVNDQYCKDSNRGEKIITDEKQTEINSLKNQPEDAEELRAWRLDLIQTCNR